MTLTPSRFDAEVIAISNEDYRLIHQSFTRDEAARRLALGEDPIELIGRAAELAYKCAYVEAYASGQCEKGYQVAMEACRDSIDRNRVPDGPRGAWRRFLRRTLAGGLL